MAANARPAAGPAAGPCTCSAWCCKRRRSRAAPARHTCARQLSPAAAQPTPPVLTCRPVSFRDLPDFPITPSATVTMYCDGHVVDTVSKKGHLKLPANAVLVSISCNVLVFVDFADATSQNSLATSGEYSSFMGGAPGAAFHARNSSVQYTHIVRSFSLSQRMMLLLCALCCFVRIIARNPHACSHLRTAISDPAVAACCTAWPRLRSTHGACAAPDPAR